MIEITFEERPILFIIIILIILILLFLLIRWIFFGDNDDDNQSGEGNIPTTPVPTSSGSNGGRQTTP
jgi:hypothetical protein